MPNGTPVILKSDGTVAAVTVAGTAEQLPAGSESIYSAGDYQYSSVAFNPNVAGQFAVAYWDKTSGHRTVVVLGTVVGSVITFYSESVAVADWSTYASLAFDPSNTNSLIVAMRDGSNSGLGAVIAGTVTNGTTVVFGTKVTFSVGNTAYVSVAFDPSTSGSFVAQFQDGGSGSQIQAVAGTVSGNAITVGTVVTIDSSGYSYNGTLTFDPNTAGRFLVAWQDQGNSNYGTVRVGIVSGTSITLGAASIVFNSSSTNKFSIDFITDVANRFVVAYMDTTGAYVVVGDIVSNTTITFGTPVLVVAAFSNPLSKLSSVRVDPNNNGRFVVAYSDASNSNFCTVREGNITGTTINLSSSVAINAVHDCRIF